MTCGQSSAIYVNRRLNRHLRPKEQIATPLPDAYAKKTHDFCHLNTHSSGKFYWNYERAK
jgi:hypothetical protein